MYITKVLVLSVLMISSTRAHVGLDSLQNNYRASDNVLFYVYTSANQTTPIKINHGDINSLIASGFSLQKPVKILVHGWKSSAEHQSNILIKNAFLNFYDVNVIVLDWSKGMLEHPSDPLALAFGLYLASFLDWLADMGVPYSKMHVVAHSLGAQAAGIAGRNCRGGKIGYISALDPPGRHWEDSPLCIRPTDGEYVEVVHTFMSGGMLIHPAGHTDFYPNGGWDMPGCGSADYWCSHNRAFEYFAESIGNTRLVGRRCEGAAELSARSCTGPGLPLGGDSPKNGTGVFYLETNPDRPYHKENTTERGNDQNVSE